MATTQTETTINNNNVIPAATIASVTAKLKESLAEITPFIPNISQKEAHYARTITNRKMESVIKAENFAEQNPKTVSPIINISEWAEELQAIVDINPTINVAEQIINDLKRYELRLEIDAMENFTIYYRTIKTLIQEGYTEAIPIYNELKKLYSNYFGPNKEKDKNTDEAETRVTISTTIKEARNMLANNKHLLKGKEIVELDSSDENQNKIQKK